LVVGLQYFSGDGITEVKMSEAQWIEFGQMFRMGTLKSLNHLSVQESCSLLILNPDKT
jgi:hypothetical protein